MDKAMDLLKRIIEETDPRVASEMGGDIYCYYCGAWEGVDAHETDCLYKEIKKYLEDIAEVVSDG